MKVLFKAVDSPGVTIALLICFSLISSFSFSQHSFSKNKTIVIAHRGDHTDAPENTVKAFDDAIKSGVDFAEVDLRTTKDGVLVVMHDETVDRMTDGKGKVSNLTLKELQRLKVQDKNHPEWGLHSVPTFHEVLGHCKGKMNIYLDFKDADVQKTYESIKAFGMENSVVVYINAEKQYTEWRRVAPRIPLMISLPDSIDDLGALRNYLEKVDAEILDGSFTEYSKEMVDLIHKMGRQVWADVQQKNENEQQWSAALSTGMDGLQTDHPQALIAYLKQERDR